MAPPGPPPMMMTSNAGSFAKRSPFSVVRVTLLPQPGAERQPSGPLGRRPGEGSDIGTLWAARRRSVLAVVGTVIESVAGEQVPADGLRVGVGRVPRGVHVLVQLGLQVGAEPFGPLVVQQALLLQVPAEHDDGVVGLRLLDLLAGAIGAVVVVGRVGMEAVGLELDQRGTAPVAGPFDRG